MLIQNFDMRKDDPTYKLKLRSDLSVKLDGFSMRTKLRQGVTATELRHRVATGHSTKSIQIGHAGVLEVVPPPSHSAALETASLPGQAVTILHGSNAGTCEALARQLAASMAARGFAPDVVDTMNSAAGGRLATFRESPVVMILASYNGLPSDNAADVLEWLEKVATQKDHKCLEGIRYAVFGCGKITLFLSAHPLPASDISMVYEQTLSTG